MGCESNHFCAMLSQKLRSQLCKGCRRRFSRAGSIENYEETRRRAFMLVDGLIAGTGYGETVLTDWPNVHLSRSIIITPGCLLNFKGTTLREEDIMFASSFVRCATDCCIAVFDQVFLEGIYRSSGEFQEAIARSTFDWIAASSEFLSIALAPTMQQKVGQLLAFLEQYHLCLSEKEIAQLLVCSRTTVSRAFSSISTVNPVLLEAYFANKNRRIILQDPV